MLRSSSPELPKWHLIINFLLLLDKLVSCRVEKNRISIFLALHFIEEMF